MGDVIRWMKVTIRYGDWRSLITLDIFITETPMEFQEEDPMAFFCKTAQSECQFPFSWQGVEYKSCTKEESEFYWCALEVDEEGLMVGDRWGKCDMKTCEVQTEEEQQKARAVFSERVEGLILFSQNSSTRPVSVEGKLTGLEDGEFTIKISSAPCGSSGPQLGSGNNFLTKDNVTLISLEAWDVSLYPDSQQYFVGGSVRLEEACSPLLSENCDVVKTVACADVQQGKGTNIDVNLILMITLIVFSVLLLILFVILIISCYRR